MLEKGLTKKKIFKILEKKLEKDLSYDSGFILGSMCTEPLKIAKKIYYKYISKNLGDPGLFLGTSELELELIKEIGELFGGKNIIGAFTTGGSEANLIAMEIAKKLRPDIKKPEVIVPLSAHISFDKASNILGIKLKKAKLKKNLELDLNHFKSLINNNTCGVVGIAGTTSLGLIDPIEQIGEILDGKNIYFHVDAAFGGFILPFLRKMGYKIPSWNFTVKSVSSITADPHKMGLGIIPSGAIFIKDPTILRDAKFEIPYLAGGTFKDFNIVGTRSGGTVIAFWAILKSLGFNGFENITRKCMENTQYLANKIPEVNGIRLAAKPVMNILGFTTENGKNINKIDIELRKRKWMLGKFTEFNLLRMIIMPHVKKEHLIQFINDLRIILKNI